MSAAAKTIDRRVVRTKRSIREAFTRLAAEKDLAAITVTELADCAAINRKTFYNYYSDIGQIAEEMEAEMLAAIESILDGIDMLRALRTPYPLFSRLTEAIGENFEVYTRIFKRNGRTGLTTKVTASLRRRFHEALEAHSKAEPGILSLTIDYCLAGILEVYRKWLQSDRSIPLEMIAERISVLAVAGLGDLLET